MLVLGLTELQAQESPTATGGKASGSGGSVSYSVGLVLYQTPTGAISSITQGVQQPFEISVLTGIEDAIGINLMILAYPNPTTDILTLKVENFDLSNLHFQLFDMTGKLLQNEKFASTMTTIAMSNLIPATYFVKVIRGREEVKTFKIVKH